MLNIKNKTLILVSVLVKTIDSSIALKYHTTNLKGDEIMKFGYTIIYVADVVATVQFYELAFGLKTTFIHESKQYAQVETGQTALAFVAEDLMAAQDIAFRKNNRTQAPAGFELAFVTENVSQAYTKALDAGAESVAMPAQKAWGQTVAYVRDNNGILIEFCSPINE